MEVNNILRTTFLTGVGLLSSSTSSESQRNYVKDVEISTIGSFADFSFSSSTRFNDSKRFSLDKLLLNKQKLESFKTLQKNWNGYEGDEIKTGLIDIAEKIISKMEYQPQIFPTGRGSIQIEKYFDDNNLYEIEISDNEIFLYKVKNGVEIEKEISVVDLDKNIADFYV